MANQNKASTNKVDRKSQIRREGWKEAGEAFKSQTVDMTKEIGKAIDIKKPVQTAVRIATQIPQGIYNTAKFIKGVFKGIFNHPYFWKYKDTLSIPAYNRNRPFDPKSIISIQGSNKFSPFGGVCHVVMNNITYHEMRNSEAFKLATIEAFKAIRLDLKSNLPYTQDAYDNYITIATSIAVKAKMIERVLGWYNVTMPDIPELQEAISNLPVNISEIGKVTAQPIQLLNKDNFAYTLNAYKKLQAICAQIAIPQKLMEFISWWVASVFTDQAQPNKQLYFNMVRSCPIYKADANYDIATIGNWDILSGSIDDVYQEAESLLLNMGIMNADIIKTKRYGSIVLAGVEESQYTPVLLNDAEYFTILINSYTMSRSELSPLLNEEYVRVDLLEDISESNAVGVTNALAKWAGATIPFTIESQMGYFTSDASMFTPRNVTYNGAFTADVSQSMEIQGTTPGFYYQFNTKLTAIADEIKQLASSATVSQIYTPDYKMPNTTLAGTFSAAALYFNAGAKVDGWIKSKTSTLYFVIPFGVKPDLSETLSLICTVDLSIPSITACGLYTSSGNSYQVPYWLDSLSGFIAGPTLIYNTHFTADCFHYYDGTVINLKMKDTALTLNAANYNKIAPYFVYDSFISSDLVKAVNIITIATANTLSVRRNNISQLHNMADLIDYHIPLVVRQSLTFNNGSNTYSSTGTAVLVKNTYIPVIFNNADINAVLYWMYLGLFSLT